MKAILLILLLALPVAAGEVYTPKPGSKERNDILNAVRDPLEDQIHQAVIFRVNHLKVQDGWAFLLAEARTKEDKPINYKGTRLEFGTREFDEEVVAVLRYKRERWYIVEHSFYASDVWWAGIHKQLKAPPAIFQLTATKR